MKQFDEERVHFLETSSPAENVTFIQNVLSAFSRNRSTHDDLGLFDYMTDWLRHNPPA